MDFKSLEIIAPILRALEESGYETPTPIQLKAIPAALSGKDVLGLAQTGTGKTAAFAVPTLQMLAAHKGNTGKRVIRSLILTPTRELAVQIFESFKQYGKHLPLRSTVVYGGVGQGNQVRALRSGVDIVIATPGRLADLINQGYINLSSVEVFTLDEADQMLDMGFIQDIQRIIKLLPRKKQTLFFSATMPKEIKEIVEDLLDDPVQVAVAPVSATIDTVEQFVYYVDRNHKVDIFAEFLSRTPYESVLVFTRTKRGADRLSKELGRKGVTVEAIHGDKSQNARQRALDNFKSGKSQVLIATDIASRGIDINDLKYVINYDLPDVPETYVHRIGRTGRAGKAGVAITFCSFQEKALLKDVEKLIRKNIEVLENETYPMVDLTPKEKPQSRRKQVKREQRPEPVKKSNRRVNTQRDAIVKDKPSSSKSNANFNKSSANRPSSNRPNSSSSKSNAKNSIGQPEAKNRRHKPKSANEKKRIELQKAEASKRGHSRPRFADDSKSRTGDRSESRFGKKRTSDSRSKGSYGKKPNASRSRNPK